MDRLPVLIVDAFADRPFSGNPAAIFPEADGLSRDEMREIADELQMEAGFVLPASSPDADLALRFLTPTGEASLSGHVTVAAFVALVDRGDYAPQEEELELVLETAAGPLRVVLEPGSDGAPQVTFDLVPPRFGEPVPAAEVAAALGLPPAYVSYEEHRPQRVSCGFDTLVVPISDRTAARGAFTDMEAIRQLADRLAVNGFACFSTETSSPEVDLFCRFFYPGAGIDEDVVSGTSLGAIAAYCLDKGIIPAQKRLKIVSEQGHARGRPNRAEIHVDMEGPRVTRIRLTATGVVVMRGELEFERSRVAAG